MYEPLFVLHQQHQAEGVVVRQRPNHVAPAAACLHEGPEASFASGT
jgi:hypothetical protein